MYPCGQAAWKIATNSMFEVVVNILLVANGNSPDSMQALKPETFAVCVMLVLYANSRENAELHSWREYCTHMHPIEEGCKCHTNLPCYRMMISRRPTHIICGKMFTEDVSSDPGMGA